MFKRKTVMTLPSIYYSRLDKGEANPLKAYKGKIKWGNDIEVVPEFTFQTIESIGGAFNEIGGRSPFKS